MTDSMKNAIDETNRRRIKQVAYNTAHDIQPASIKKSVRDLTDRVRADDDAQEALPEGEYRSPGAEFRRAAQALRETAGKRVSDMPKEAAQQLMADLETQMKQAAKDLEFEKAAALRDQIMELRQRVLGVDPNAPAWEQARKGIEIEDKSPAQKSKGDVQYKPKRVNRGR
jgi:excinuclease ABC subunit B